MNFHLLAHSVTTPVLHDFTDRDVFDKASFMWVCIHTLLPPVVAFLSTECLGAGFTCHGSCLLHLHGHLLSSECLHPCGHRNAATLQVGTGGAQAQDAPQGQQHGPHTWPKGAPWPGSGRAPEGTGFRALAQQRSDQAVHRAAQESSHCA